MLKNECSINHTSKWPKGWNLWLIPTAWCQTFFWGWLKDSRCIFGQSIRTICISHDLEFIRSYCSKWFLFLEIILLALGSICCCALSNGIDGKTASCITQGSTIPSQATHHFILLKASFSQSSFKACYSLHSSISSFSFSPFTAS